MNYNFVSKKQCIKDKKKKKVNKFVIWFYNNKSGKFLSQTIFLFPEKDNMNPLELWKLNFKTLCFFLYMKTVNLLSKVLHYINYLIEVSIIVKQYPRN